MFSILLQTASSIINSFTCVILTPLTVYSIKNVHETYWYCSSKACQEKRKDWILRIFSFNDKNPLYLPIIATFHVVFLLLLSLLLLLLLLLLLFYRNKT